MKVFNTFYYSWSPVIADEIWSNSLLQSTGRIIISPLLGILHVSTVVNSIFSFNTELAIVLTGFIASSLIGAVYFMPITVGVLYAVGCKKKFLPRFSKFTILLAPWSLSIILIYIGEIMSSTLLLMAGTGAFVVFTIAIITWALTLEILKNR